MNNALQDNQKVIYHEGVAEKVTAEQAVVRFVQNGACGACQLKSVCNPAEQRVRLVTACHDGTLRTGDTVRLAVQESVAWLSILFSFLFPFIVVATTFFAVYFKSGDDIRAGLTALAVLPAYYLIVFLSRHKLAARVQFTAVAAPATETNSVRGIS